MSEDKGKIIAIDFDGTLAIHEYPEIGDEVPRAFDTLKMLQRNGHRLMLWTMRDGETLDDAVAYCKERGVEFWGINKNPEQHTWNTNKTKQYAHIYIDDAALGCPLIYAKGHRPFVDWIKVALELKSKNIL